MKKTNRSACDKAYEIIKINRNLIDRNFYSPLTVNEVKASICSFDLSIEFCDTIINSLKWYNISLKPFYKDVKIYIIQEKITFLEQQNKYLKYKYEEKDNN
jgi:hypothetical protein